MNPAIKNGNYYFCAYGNIIRWSQKHKTEKEAAIECFGTSLRVTCINVGSRTPKYMYTRRVKALQKLLVERHYEQTGNVITLT